MLFTVWGQKTEFSNVLVGGIGNFYTFIGALNYLENKFLGIHHYKPFFTQKGQKWGKCQDMTIKGLFGIHLCTFRVGTGRVLRSKSRYLRAQRSEKNF